MKGPQYSLEQVAAAVEQSGGNKADAARAIGCSPATIREYAGRYEPVRAAWERAMAARVGAGESGSTLFDGRRRPRFAIEQVAVAVEQARGDKMEAARAVGCSRDTIARYIARYEPVREAYRRAYEACAAAEERRPGCAPGGPPRWRYRVEEVAEAVRQARGLAHVAARSLGCASSTVAAYIEHFPEVRQAYDEARAGMIDVVENKLSQAVDQGDLRAVTFVLSMLGKDRGYTKKESDTRPVVDDDEPAELEATLEEVLAQQRGDKATDGDEGESDEEEAGGS